MGSIYRYVAIDIVVLFLLGLASAVLGLVLKAHKRGFFRHDQSIGLPFTLPDDQIIPTGLLWFWSIVTPIIVMAIFWVFVDKILTPNTLPESCEEPLVFQGAISTSSTRGEDSVELLNAQQTDPLFSNNTSTTKNDAIYRNVKKSLQSSATFAVSQQQINFMNWGIVNTKGSTVFGRKVRFIVYQLFVFFFVVMMSHICTTALKLTVSRLRPDFLARCIPDYTYPGLDKVMDPETGYIPGDWVDRICQGVAEHVEEGRRSFPSGHSSSAMTGSMFIAIYLYKRFFHRGRAVFGTFFTPTLMCFSIIMALWIGATRTIDYWHNPSDVIIGLMIGAVAGLLALVFEPFTPSWEVENLYNSQMKSDINNVNNNSNDGTSLSSSNDPNTIQETKKDFFTDDMISPQAGYP